MPPAPAWILLNRSVDYIFDDDEPSSSVTAAAVVEFLKSTWGSKASSITPLYQPTIAMLLSMKPDAAAVAAFPEPPEIATFRLRASKSHRASVSSSSHLLVACADKGLLVIYAGSYFGPSSSSKCGCYLIHDANANADADAVLSTVPPPPETDDLEGMTSGAVILRYHHHPAGAGSSSSSSSSAVYLLAELAMMPKRQFPDPDAALLLWRSESDEQPTPPEWVRKEVHLPREVRWAPGDDNDKHMFNADTSFAGPGGCLCWVDLLNGIVVCANPHQYSPVLRFVPLPDGCPSFGWSDYPYRPRTEESRAAACVGGRIKVVAMVGELEGWNAHQYRLTTWTLSPPSSPDDDDDLAGGGWQWQEDGVFPLEELWATEEYLALNLPPQTPVCPLLSAAHDDDEDGVVVYAVVNDIEERAVVQGRIQKVVVGTELEFKRQIVLGIDVRRNRIVSTSSGVPRGRVTEMQPHLLPFDFGGSPSRHGGAAKREVDASQVDDSTESRG